jgi:hypothetical protein
MPLPPTKKLALGAAAAALIAIIFLAANFSVTSKLTVRQQLLRFVPTDATAVAFLDVEDFRQSPFLRKLYAWAPHPVEDSEYTQFVRDTGFSYERDLQRVMLAISNHGPSTNFLAIAEGNFDRQKIESFLATSAKASQQGKWKVFILSRTSSDQPLLLTFLSDHRMAFSNSEHLLAILSAASDSGRAEWNARFERLAGTPLFAVIRQDSATQEAFNAAAPGGFRSPQLSALLNQLQWISIAGKPEGDQLQLVSEGECLSEAATSQLQDLLKGLVILAQSGLHDPKLRQQMNPEERQAYLEVLKGMDIQKIDRGDWKSVRVILSVTPKFLEVARASSLSAPSGPESVPASASPPADKNRSKSKHKIRTKR